MKKTSMDSTSKKSFGSMFQIFLAVLVYALFFVYILCFSLEEPRYDLFFEHTSSLWEGITTTLAISGLALLGSMVLGFGLFLILQSKQVFLRTIAVFFREMVLGTPLLVMLFLAVYVVGDLAQVNDKFVLGVSALILYMCPYLANSYETAVAVVGKNQYIVMDLYDFTTFQKYRYIIIPQMIGPLIPSLINQLSSIVKGSALLKIISVSELSYVLTVISSRNWAVIEGYYIMWLCYLSITIPLSLLAKYLGHRIS